MVVVSSTALHVLVQVKTYVHFFLLLLGVTLMISIHHKSYTLSTLEGPGIRWQQCMHMTDPYTINKQFPSQTRSCILSSCVAVSLGRSRVQASRIFALLEVALLTIVWGSTGSSFSGCGFLEFFRRTIICLSGLHLERVNDLRGSRFCKSWNSDKFNASVFCVLKDAETLLSHRWLEESDLE